MKISGVILHAISHAAHYGDLLVLVRHKRDSEKVCISIPELKLA